VEFYQRSLAETAIRIRLLRVVESKAISEIAKISPESAQKWAEYEADEMLHDEMFIQDLIASGYTREEFMRIEPTMSTKLLVGFFSYLLDHEGPLGVVAYSYLVEYVNVKLESEKLIELEKILGKEKIIGQLTHANTDIGHDHPGMVWECLRYLINNDNDIENLKKYLKEFQQILLMFFVETSKEFNISSVKKEVA
jgi:pyrroloquinoline quinone (PQQ) biosynthesis protein C